MFVLTRAIISFQKRMSAPQVRVWIVPPARTISGDLHAFVFQDLLGTYVRTSVSSSSSSSSSSRGRAFSKLLYLNKSHNLINQFSFNYSYKSIINPIYQTYCQHLVLSLCYNSFFNPLWRSCELFCVGIFHEPEGRMKYHYTKQWIWSPQGSPTHLFLFLCCTIDVISSSGILPVLCDLHQTSRYGDRVQNRP